MSEPEKSPTEGETSPSVEGTLEQSAQVETAQVESPAVVPAPVVNELLAPDAPRMQAPAYAAKSVPDPAQNPPSGLFLAVVAIASLVADVSTKLWAEAHLTSYPGTVEVIPGNLQFVLAKNKGGAWGLLQGATESLRRPFFLIVSVLAISFIVSLYRRLNPRQQALKWGLPLVLGGALGNVFDRVRYGHVIDFIDYRADWVEKLNQLVKRYSPTHYVTDHWPTFNVADIAICIGVVLMAVDMFTSRRGKQAPVMVADVPLTHVHVDADGNAVVDRQPEGVGADEKEPGAVIG